MKTPATDKKNILLAGRPRVGKSTLLFHTIEKLRQIDISDIGGFYTLEVSSGGKRIGFDINTLDGRIGCLARIGLDSPCHLVKYGIDMKQFESIALSALEDAIKNKSVIVVDEIGYMELKSMWFRELIEKALNSPKPVIATIMRNRFDFTDKIKAREDVMLITVTAENRDRLINDIVELVRQLTTSKLKEGKGLTP